MIPKKTRHPHHHNPHHHNPLHLTQTTSVGDRGSHDYDYKAALAAATATLPAPLPPILPTTSTTGANTMHHDGMGGGDGMHGAQGGLYVRTRAVNNARPATPPSGGIIVRYVVVVHAPPRASHHPNPHPPHTVPPHTSPNNNRLAPHPTPTLAPAVLVVA